MWKISHSWRVCVTSLERVSNWNGFSGTHRGTCCPSQREQRSFHKMGPAPPGQPRFLGTGPLRHSLLLSLVGGQSLLSRPQNMRDSMNCLIGHLLTFPLLPAPNPHYLFWNLGLFKVNPVWLGLYYLPATMHSYPHLDYIMGNWEVELCKTALTDLEGNPAFGWKKTKEKSRNACLLGMRTENCTC